MPRVRNSFTGKLTAVVLATTAIALLVAGAALLVTDVRSARRALADDLATEAGILALATAPALSFDDRESASRILSAMQARTEIRAAALYSPDGALYASYVRAGEPAVASRTPAIDRRVRIGGGSIEYLQPIVQSGETIGTIYLHEEYHLGGRLAAYAGILAFVMLLSLGVALLASARLRRIITDPMDSMARVAREIVQHRDYSLRASKTTVDDINLVVDAFNSMLDEVQARTRDLQDSNRRLQEQAAVRLAAEHALRDADRRKDEFLATLAHELRNPLAPIRNAVRILELPSADERQRRWGREVIAHQVHHMALLLDDLLDVSRITRGQLELRKDYVGLQSVVEGAIETARPLIETKRHELSVQLPPYDLTLEADPLRLSQVLGNLLMNAAKYMDPGGRIALTVGLSGAELSFSVRDNGIGLSPDTIPRLFTMFSQVNTAIDRAEGGLGIGLALVKGLVSLHGGTVEARSEGLERGSEFIVRLPAAAVVSQRSRLPVRANVPEPLRRPGRVLIVDDNRDAAETLAAVLRFSGYEVFTAFSGPEALDLASREHPHALLLDIGLPGVSGYDVARRIRLQAWGKHAVLIAVTGWGQDEDKHAARAAGFDDHLTKPVDPSALDHLLGELLLKGAGARPSPAADSRPFGS